ncbi:pentatricopeptide repeat-containing protein At4g04790, mitochondrial-like isoform X2 [Cornus florida]|uniref:pentatricopeptide repeat-containing protein At4g04790, mitochondrial-like isoform X2 n=1 Tax=Cornus florida TaxID=4283 RepID=UPI00289CDC67|nr:pentatricopeptide repeat-containing protein At4g04790, mitochondrial-like isoform X2 [Cornus florida]
MPASKAKKLSSLFRSAIKTTSRVDDRTLKQFVSSIDSSPATQRSIKIRLPHNKPLSPSNNFDAAPSRRHEHSAKQLSREISALLCGGKDSDLVSSPDSQVSNSLEKVLDIPWFSSLSHNNISLQRKEISRERKQKWVFKSSQTHRFGRLVRMCAEKLGTDATIQVFGKLGRETGIKEYNALIGLCVEKAKRSKDEEVSLQQAYKAFQLFKSMREQGFPLEEETYGPFLVYLIDMCMVEEFQFFCGVIRDENPNSLSRLAYYEMMLWIRVDNEDKIQELCNYIPATADGGKPNIRENYLLALCESDRKKELLLLLDIVDITRISSPDHVATIFKSLGRLLLEPYAEKFILAFKTCDNGAENISNFIYNYAISMPNLAVEDVILTFKNLHAKLEVTPSSISFEKLIKFSCDSLKVHVALDLVDQMLEVGLTSSIGMFHSLLEACEEDCEYNLVRRIYSAICRHKLKPNCETFRIMINLCVRMKDFDGAYGMIVDLQKMNLTPTASMYNAIMLGYFREKNFYGGLMVLKQMETADVKPDAQTFSYLIGNSDREENIIKHFEELKDAGVQVTKHIFMALIHAYAACGQHEKAKQVVLDKGIPVKNLNEIKSVLLIALASHGQMSDALNIYKEIKEAKCKLEPKAIKSLIDHLQSEGELSRLLQLLEELDDSDYWHDGCFRIILYCVQHKHLSSAIDLLKQLKDKFCNDEVATEVFLDEVFCQIAETEPPDLQIGLDLLQAIKEELDLRPSRKCLDFLLSACVNAKDVHGSLLIWKEYQTAGLPYNTLSFLRMYQALLASGNHKSATNMLKHIPRDDPHVRSVIKACQATYSKFTSEKGNKKNIR